MATAFICSSMSIEAYPGRHRLDLIPVPSYTAPVLKACIITLLILTLAGIAHADYAELIKQDQPAAWWRFDDSDETAKDASGQGHHGISRDGVTPSEGLPGSKGKAVRFNGT